MHEEWTLDDALGMQHSNGNKARGCVLVVRVYYRATLSRTINSQKKKKASPKQLPFRFGPLVTLLYEATEDSAGFFPCSRDACRYEMHRDDGYDASRHLEIERKGI